jgi:holo-[acyl-carrier protein] synthase
MNIKGIGTDIIEVDRIRQAIDRHGQHFLNRLFTENEQAYCLKFPDVATHFAGRFAAKEAIAKAFGLGFGNSLSWKDMEILPNSLGRPIVHLSPRIKKEFLHFHLHISISHTQTYAIAFAVLE